MKPGMDGMTGSCLPRDGYDAPSGQGGLLTSVRDSQQGSPLLRPLPYRSDELTIPGQWPLRSHIDLGALSSATPCARLHTRHVLWEWGQKNLIEDAGLIASELTTNATTATQAIGSLHPVRLWLLSDQSQTLVMMGDASPHSPKLADPAPDADGGRGLVLVAALSSSWGWYNVHMPTISKVVWAELACQP